MTSLTLLSAHYFWKSHNTLKPTQTHTHTHSKSNSSPVLAPANPLFCLLHPHLLFSLLPHPPRPWQNVSKPLYVFSSIIFPWDSYMKKNALCIPPRGSVSHCPYHNDRNLYKSDWQVGNWLSNHCGARAGARDRMAAMETFEGDTAARLCAYGHV